MLDSSVVVDAATAAAPAPAAAAVAGLTPDVVVGAVVGGAAGWMTACVSVRVCVSVWVCVTVTAEGGGAGELDAVVARVPVNAVVSAPL